MTGTKFAEWEVRSAVLAGRAQTLRDTAFGYTALLTDAERLLLLEIAERLREEARRVARAGSKK